MKVSHYTRLGAIAGISAMTLYAMHLRIDGIMVPLFGVAAVSGLAGYDIGIETASAFAGLERNRKDTEDN